MTTNTVCSSSASISFLAWVSPNATPKHSTPLKKVAHLFFNRVAHYLYYEGDDDVPLEHPVHIPLDSQSSQTQIDAISLMGFGYCSGAFGKEAADLGHAASTMRLGLFYRIGFGVEKRETKSFVWMQKAAALNCPMAQFTLGQMHYDGYKGKHIMSKH
ncbi:hypothetical protein INT47_000539 [Mucor saturninus]|uniref:Uncharacterized protein n=1 Tax=Mucor saturninus TaxID=64648 RepID=A0A8H7R185_9FUNG|nr:hypothetical protein INT47_000539 [Mucor saturninus]